MKVILADRSKTLRSALRLIVEMETNLTVTGEAASGDELLALAVTRRPELIIVDWELPGLEIGANGESVADGSRLIVMANDPRARREALAAGADYFVSRGDPPKKLLEAIDAAVSALSEDSECGGKGV